MISFVISTASVFCVSERQNTSNTQRCADVRKREELSSEAERVCGVCDGECVCGCTSASVVFAVCVCVCEGDGITVDEILLGGRDADNCRLLRQQPVCAECV